MMPLLESLLKSLTPCCPCPLQEKMYNSMAPYNAQGSSNLSQKFQSKASSTKDGVVPPLRKWKEIIKIS